MQLDSEKLKKLIEYSAKDIGNFEVNTLFIGEISNKPVMISVMTRREAVETHEYNGIESIHKNLICIKD